MEDRDTANTPNASLTRQLLQQIILDQRISNEAVIATSELVRHFVIEARHRALVEVRGIIESTILFDYILSIVFVH